MIKSRAMPKLRTVAVLIFTGILLIAGGIPSAARTPAKAFDTMGQMLGSQGLGLGDVFGIAGVDEARIQAFREGAVPTATETMLLAVQNSGTVRSALKELEEAVLDALTLQASLGWRADAVLVDQFTRTFSDEDDNGGGSIVIPGIGEINLPDFPGSPAPDTRNIISGTLALRRSLFPGPDTQISLSQVNLGIEQARAQLEQAVVDMAVTAFSAYRQLELAILQQNILTRVIADLESRLETAHSQLEQGTITSVDLEQARLDRDQTLQALAQTRRMIEIAERRLMQIIGLEVGTFSVDDLELPTAEDILVAIESGSEVYWPQEAFPWAEKLEDLIETAIANRNELTRARLGVEMAAKEVERARLGRRVQIQGDTAYSWSEKAEVNLSLDNDGILQGTATVAEWYDLEDGGTWGLGDDPEWRIGVQVNINLFDNHVTNLAVQKAQSQLARAEQALKDATTGIELDVMHRHSETLAAYDQLHLQSSQTILERDRLATEIRRHEIGLSTDLQVQAATTRLYQGVVDAVSARFDYEGAVLETAKSIGLSFVDLFHLALDLERR